MSELSTECGWGDNTAVQKFGGGALGNEEGERRRRKENGLEGNEKGGRIKCWGEVWSYGHARDRTLRCPTGIGPQKGMSSQVDPITF